MKICYSQRPSFPQLQAASSSWSVWIASPFPLCSISGRVMEMWTFEQAELIYLLLLCFSPVPASTQNICFVFYSSFNWEWCWMLSNWLLLSSTVRLQHYFLSGQFCQGKPESTTEASNCWDSASVLRESAHTILFLSVSSLSSGKEDAFDLPKLWGYGDLWLHLSFSRMGQPYF